MIKTETLDYLLARFEESIRNKVIEEFTHQLKETFNQEFPSDYESTKPYFTLENAKMIVDVIAEQLKGGSDKPQ